MRRFILFTLLLGALAAPAWSQTATVLFLEQVDTEAEWEALVTDVANFIISTEIDTEAELEALVGALNLIIETEVDTLAELNAILTDATLEEDAHEAEHRENGADELLGENLGTACAENQILKANATGGMDCAADSTGGSPSFDAITGGTNTGAAMLVGTGASLAPTGSGSIVSTDLQAASEVVSDAEVVDTLTASNYLPLAGGTMTGDITLSERSSDPSNPSEGQWVCWMSDGVGSGADGDVLCKITAGAVTRTVTLFDFSAIP